VAELGARAGAQYQGDGLSVVPTPEGARLRCVFQRLEGQVTREGLWLTSTVEPRSGEKFRVVARAVGREVALKSLPSQGSVTVTDKLARYQRPALIEEYSVSMDGVRQDFVVAERPAGDGPLRVELDVTGAKAEALVNGARLTLDSSGRKLVYARLHVVDAGGNTLTARMKVTTEAGLAVLVEDGGAVYPVRIDPTFSDANWVSMGGIPGLSGTVSAAVLDGPGNLYIGGSFTIAGDVFTTNIAKWDGSAWSALGSGMDSTVSALAVSGTSLYAGGVFLTAGGKSAYGIAKWDGSAWSALTPTLGSGLGMYSWVYALAVSGTNLYAGGRISTAGDNWANNIAKWDGSAWSALGSGMNDCVYALAVSGTNLYAGGSFTNAGGITASRIVKWNGSAWSALGSGMNSEVSALLASGTDLYAGGSFTNAGGITANRIAKWNGSAWSALGSGMNSGVSALLATGTDLYAGGSFTKAGGNTANYFAKWDGSVW